MRNTRHILLVEDDEVDVMTVKRAFKEINVKNPMHVAENGEDALAFLKDHTDEKPCIIILDLNLPKMNGLEFLKTIKQDNHLGIIPVVVLTTSRDRNDKYESFKNHAAGYMIKTTDYKQFVEVMRTIDKYWTASEMPEL
jgi:CheY-like chemotaxis protein